MVDLSRDNNAGSVIGGVTGQHATRDAKVDINMIGSRLQKVAESLAEGIMQTRQAADNLFGCEDTDSLRGVEEGSSTLINITENLERLAQQLHYQTNRF